MDISVEKAPRFFLWDLIEMGGNIIHFKTIADGCLEVKIYFTSKQALAIFFNAGVHLFTHKKWRAPHDSLLAYEHQVCAFVKQLKSLEDT